MKWIGPTYQFVFLVLLIAGAAISCEEPYEPKIPEQSQNFLVVEGHLQNGLTSLKISRTVKLQEAGNEPESGALVSVEDIHGNVNVLFTEENSGYYEASLSLEDSTEYRLVIRTTNGDEFKSEPIPVINSPQLDQLEWVVNDGNVEILASSQANQSDTRYYRYTFTETWEYTSRFKTSLQYINGDVAPLPPEDQYYTCYKTESSHAVNITTTKGFVDNKVSRHLITSISPLETARLKIRYSILVQQYGISREAFDFYDRLKANTENLGTLFDPQPSMLITNIYGTNNDTEVIGFITAGSVAQKRIFIERSELPFLFYNTDYANCAQEAIPFPMAPYDYHYYFKDGKFLPITKVGPASYMGGSPACVDCRIQGGVTEKPGFW